VDRIVRGIASFALERLYEAHPKELATVFAIVVLTARPRRCQIDEPVLLDALHDPSCDELLDRV